MSYYVGIDIGTSSAKTVLIDEKGKMLKESSRNYEVAEPESGWKEINPENWMRAVTACLREMCTGIDMKAVQSIGVTGQMHSVVTLDEKGKVIRPALMWNDTRTIELVGMLKGKIKQSESVPYLANIISTGSPAVNLLWIKTNEPENFKRVKKFLIGPDYIVYRLTGNMQTDFCEASTSSLYDLKEKKWSEEMRTLLGFPEEIYPEVKGSAENAGTVCKEWIHKLGFDENTTVTVGTGDNPAAAISTGCFTGKYPVLSLGTSAVMMFSRSKPDFCARGKNILFSFDGNDVQVLVQGVVQSCGSSFDWWMKKVLETEKFDKETAIDTRLLGKSEVIFYPHLVGDKTIYADSKLRGAFIGIGTDTDRKTLSVAVMEGICLAIRQLTEAMEMPEESLQGLRVIGGGSKNGVWMQILANVLNKEIVQMESGFGAGYGIALAAASKDAQVSIEEIIKNTVKIKKRFVPISENVILYEEKYQKYLKIYDALKMVVE